MLKDITLGQFFPGNSAVHRLDGAAGSTHRQF